MIYFNFSNKLTNNLTSLYNLIKNQRKNFFTETKIIISSSHYKRCIEENFLIQENVCLNLSFDFLEPFLGEIFINSLNLNKNEIIILSLERNKVITTSLIFQILNEKKFRESHQTILNSILQNIKNKFYEINLLWKLSEVLTDLFREYEYHRYDEIIRKWKKNELSSNAKELELFQKEIYDRIFIKKEFFKEKGKFYTITQLFEEVKERGTINIPYEKLYLFGFAQISELHLKMLDFLKNYTDIYLFSQNYLRLDYNKFPYKWNELEEKFYPENKPFHFLDEVFSPVIKMNFLIKDKINNNLIFDWNEPKEINVLNSTKKYLLSRNKLDKKLKEDDSLQIFSATSRENEIMAIYNSILYNLENDKELTFDDILIILPNIELYKNILNDIFNKNPYQCHPEIKKEAKIPFYIYEKTSAEKSHFSGILTTFFELMENNFSNFSLVKLLENPLLMKKFKLTKEDLIFYRKWIESTGMFDEDEFFKITKTSHALKRIKFGIIMEKDENFSAYKEIIPYEENISSLESLDNFIVIIEKLSFYFNEGKTNKKLEDWISYVKSFIDEFVDSEDTEENQIHLFFLRNLKIIRELSSVINREFSLCEAKVHFINLLTSSEFIKKEPIFSGVSVSSFLPVRAVPFKLIYIAGMNEGEFPARLDKSTLNLRNLKKLPNDISKRELDIFMFIEAILTAEKKLYISYLGYNQEDDVKLYPSSVIYYLLDILNNNILDTRLEIKELPFSPLSKKLIPKRDIITNFYFTPYRMLLRSKEEIKKTQTIPIPYSEREISISSLGRFILNPVEEMIKKKDGIYEFDDEIELTISRKDSLDEYLKHILLSKAARISFENDINFKSAINNLYNHYKLMGKTPESEIFKQIELTSIKIENIETIIKETTKNFNYYERIIIGEGYENEKIKIYKPYEIKGRKITGIFEDVFVNDTTILMIKFQKEIKNLNLKKYIKHYLNLKLFLSILNKLDKNIVQSNLLIIGYADGRSEVINISPLPNEILEQLIEQYLKEDNFYLLPLKILIDKINHPIINRIEILEEINEKENSEFDKLNLITPLAIQREYEKFIPEEEIIKEWLGLLSHFRGE